MRLENFFYEADLRYRMDSLFADCCEVKGEPLTAEERLFFRAAACGAAIQEAAKVLDWQLNTAQVFVSGTIKVYVKKLIAMRELGQQAQARSRMAWHQLSYALQALGYERSQKIDEQSLFEAVSSESCDIDIERLVWEINDAIYRIKFNDWKPLLTSDCRKLMEEEIKQKSQLASKSKDAAVKREAYVEAIKLSRLIVIQDPLEGMDHVVKIAQNLNMIERYADSVPLAREFMGYMQTLEAKAKLNFVLARAYEEVALETLCEYHRQQSMNYYQSAIDWGTQRNCFALYNVFTLNFEFSQKKPKSHSYLAKAHLSLRKFVEEGRGSGSNFLRYRSEIQDSVRDYLARTDDPLLVKDLGVILEW